MLDPVEKATLTMKMHTIAAISTPAGSGGIGIIKISGPEAIPISLSIFKPKSPSTRQGTILPPTEKEFPISRHLYYGHVFIENFDKVIDEALFAVMREPHSYTGEDVVEIQTHAGYIVLQTILNTLIHKGARIAEPGEFTRRAFLNGRIDLTQAEAVIDIINARSARSVDMATPLMSGELKHQIKTLREILWNALSFIEAAIDFPDDMDGEIDPVPLFSQIENEVVPKIQTLISHYAEFNFLREGLRIVIVGGSNVGKSSLMNRLINKKRSIVTDIPGTTRDFIEDSFISNGTSIIITDTAGIRDNPDPVEQIGIEKAWDIVSEADMILFMLDAGNEITSRDISIFERLASKKKLIVINKIDLPREQICLSLPETWVMTEAVRVSALYNQGIDDLKEKIDRMVISSEFQPEHKIIPNLRQKQCLENALHALNDAQNGFFNALPFETISIDLRSAIKALSEITGEDVQPDILDAIFSRFCIGK